MGARICLLYDGFFSFAVVRQVFLLFILLCYIKDEEVAPYLSEAFSRYASGRKMRDIAKWLNEQGVDPPMKHKKRILGKPYDAEPDQWTTDMLRCLFRNPT